MLIRRRAVLWLGVFLILAGSIVASVTQTAGYSVRVQDVRWTGTNGTPMSALLYVPPGATARTPAPGILAVHGYINSRETQDGFAIEFARRGYVVLAMDQTGHGYSGAAARENGYGGVDGLRYLRGLDIVDPANIGLEGHSMGGWTVLTAAKAMPDAYKAVVLEGSSTGSNLAPEGSPAFPRNLALVYSQFDEFSALMWNVPRARDVVTSPKLQAVFGSGGPVEPGRLYGSVADGTARELWTPATTHPQDHISPEAIGHALDWFGQTLAGGTPRPASDQVWFWKEAGTGVALVGFVLFLLGMFDLLLGLPVFAGLRGVPAAVRTGRGPAWWLAFLLTTAVPVLTYFPLFDSTPLWLKPNAWLPQLITNQIGVWALVNAAVTIVLALLLRGGRAPVGGRVGASFAIAVLTAAAGMAVLAAMGALFTVDFRFWVVALKLPNLQQARIALPYLVVFAVFFAVALRALHTNLHVGGSSAAAQYAGNVGALALGFLLFVGTEYITLFATGQLLSPGEPLNTIVAIQFVPLLAFVGVVATWCFRRTGTYWPGAFLCALVVTWYIVAGQATQFHV